LIRWLSLSRLTFPTCTIVSAESGAIVSTIGVAALILRVVVGVVFVPSVVVAVYVPAVPSSLRVTVLREDVPSHCEKVSLEFLVAVGRRAIVATIEQAWG
jgi:hypothetical protein